MSTDIVAHNYVSCFKCFSSDAVVACETSNVYRQLYKLSTKYCNVNSHTFNRCLQSLVHVYLHHHELWYLITVMLYYYHYYKRQRIQITISDCLNTLFHPWSIFQIVFAIMY